MGCCFRTQIASFISLLPDALDCQALVVALTWRRCALSMILFAEPSSLTCRASQAMLGCSTTGVRGLFRGRRSLCLSRHLSQAVTARTLVVVESPAKAKKIGTFLGPDYVVLASYGHVRDLVPKAGSVDPRADFSMLWESRVQAQKRIRDISSALAASESLILATDADREGEAISWHLLDMLKVYP